MKIMCELIRYQFRQYVLSAKYVMPVIVLCAVFSVMYGVMPVKIVSSFAIMGLVLFLLMAWVGVTCQEVEPEVSGQIILLRVKSERMYYVSQVLLIAVLSVLASVLSVVLPVIKHFVYHRGLFSRDIVGTDIVGGFLLMYACSFVGGMVGEIFSPYIIRKREMGIGLTVLLALVSVTRIGVVQEFPVSRWVLWIVPPVSDVVGWFTREEVYDMASVMRAFVLLMLYGELLAVLKVEISRIRKF